MESEHPIAFDGASTLDAKPEPRRSEAGGWRQQALAVKRVLTVLEALPPEGRARVIRACAALYGVGIP